MRRLRFETPRAWRRARRTVVGLAFAGLLMILVGVPAMGQVLFGCGLLGLVLLESLQLRHSLQESERQQYALSQIRPLAGELPLDFSSWAADPILVYNAVRLVLDTRPALVLECGSGSSTVVLARCLRALGRGRVVSLDHDPTFAGRTAQLLHMNDLTNLAEVITAPLVTRRAGDQVFQWYAPDYEPFLRAPIDLLLVDGPPGGGSVLARYPAVPLLQSCLSPNCSILLDDGNRRDERLIAHQWAEMLGASLIYLPGGRGAWLLRRQGSPGASHQLAG
jgi:methyltransferase family protein